MANNQEKLKPEYDNNIEIDRPIIEKKEILAKTPESTVELSPRDIESRTEKARVEALENAVSVEKISDNQEKIHQNPSRHGPINKKQRNTSFKHTMTQVQKELPAGGRMFSKIIHNNVIEKTSDAIGGTIARPNALFAGAFTAFVLTLLTYTIAKTIGYSLSGFETIAAFILGWIIGITYDYLKITITGTGTKL